MGNNRSASLSTQCPVRLVKAACDDQSRGSWPRLFEFVNSSEQASTAIASAVAQCFEKTFRHQGTKALSLIELSQSLWEYGSPAFRLRLRTHQSSLLLSDLSLRLADNLKCALSKQLVDAYDTVHARMCQLIWLVFPEVYYLTSTWRQPAAPTLSPPSPHTVSFNHQRTLEESLLNLRPGHALSLSAIQTVRNDLFFVAGLRSTDRLITLSAVIEQRSRQEEDAASPPATAVLAPRIVLSSQCHACPPLFAAAAA